jgi:nucleoid DNA-binding protein
MSGLDPFFDLQALETSPAHGLYSHSIHVKKEEAMAELKTKKNEQSVHQFLDSVSDPVKRQDSYTLLQMMEKATGEKAKMWGDSLVGFGDFHYKYVSGREGDWMLTAFSPRKDTLSLYLMCGFNDLQGLLFRLGKYKTGKGCLYIKKLADVNQEVLEELIRESVKLVQGKAKL